MNENWKCIYHNGNNIYFAKVVCDEVIISDGCEVVRRYSLPGVNGCFYNGTCLWVSTEGDNSLTVIDNADNKTIIQLHTEEPVRILKAVSGVDNCMVVIMPGADNGTYAVFDCINKKIIINLPITVNCNSGSDTLDELFFQDWNSGKVICKYATWITSHYMDEMDDRDILFYANLAWGKNDSVAKIEKRIHLNIDYEHSDSSDGNQTLLSDLGLKFPLFDFYLRHWLSQKSFSTSGKYVVYYCSDISGIIIGTSDGGDIYRIFELPREIAKEDNQFYYNDLKNILYVIDHRNEISIYSVICSEQKAIEELNIAYNNAYNSRTNLQRRRDAGDLSFWNVLNKAIDSCICIPKPLNQQVDDAEHLDCYVVTVETPIDGVIYHKDTQKKLGSFEGWNYRKDIIIPRFDKNSELIFVYNAGESKQSIILKENGMNRYNIAIEDELIPEDIVKCCDRASAREKLQEEPTNRYATTQLGYCGMVEDYNFLLAIFEDYYCKSVVHHGRSSANVKACVKSITKLAFKFQRKDAISALRNLLILTNETDLISEIKNSTVLLSEMCGFIVSDKQFRFDLQIKSFVDITIHDKINGLHLFHKANTSSTYYLRSTTGKLELWVEFANKTISIECSAEYGNYHIFDVLDNRDDKIQFAYIASGKVWQYFIFDKENNNVILDRYMGGECEYVNLSVVQKKVSVPAFVSIIGNRAFQGGSVTEVIVPSSVYAIGDEAFRYSDLQSVLLPNSVTKIGISAFADCSYLEEIVLPHKLNDISDSLFENSSLRKVEVPGNVERIGVRAFANCISLEKVVVQDGVEVIASGAFSGCKSLKAITIPDSVTYIESKAFEMCDNIVITGAKGSYAEKYAAKNSFSFDGSMTTCRDSSHQDDLQVVSRAVARMEKRQLQMEEKQGQIADMTRSVVVRTASMDDKLMEIDDRLRDLQTWVKSIFDIVEKKKASLVDIEKSKTEEEIEKIRAEFISATAKEIANFTCKDTSSVAFEESHLKGVFGDYWEQLDDYTRKSLVSAKVFLANSRSVTYGGLDFSGVCISTCSALEQELKLRFFTGYKAFLKGKFEDDFSKWPRSMKFRLNNGNYTENSQFSIGKLPGIFGTQHRNEKTGVRYYKTDAFVSDEEKGLLNEYIKTISNYEGVDASVFYERDSFGLSFLDRCEDVRCMYRNAAAHTESLSVETATACCRDVIGISAVDATNKIGQVQGLIYDLVRLTRLPNSN